MSKGLYSSTYVREEDGKVIQMSGYTYVPMRCWSDTPDHKFDPVRVRFASTCEHGITVCLECVESWSWDHQIAFERTKAGRDLLAGIEADPELLQKVKRQAESYG